MSDIAGILYEQQRAGKPLSYEMIDQAVLNLYGGWQDISDYAREVLHKVLEADNLEQLFIELSEDEASTKEALIEIDKKYPKILNENNIDEVIAAAMRKKEAGREGQ